MNLTAEQFLDSAIQMLSEAKGALDLGDVESALGYIDDAKDDLAKVEKVIEPT